MSDTNKFLKLPAMRDRFSFRSAQALHHQIAHLPNPPQWKSCIVKVDGGTTRKPIRFFHRNSKSVFRFLFGNPLYANHQDLKPVRVWEDGIQLFEGPMSGSITWEIQDKIGRGETLGLVILGSDKTHLNNCYGDKKAHCVYMSCGNISKDIRMKESAGCWVKVAEIPVVKFLEKSHQSLLSDRLFHVCMDVLTSGLKECSRCPEKMTDGKGIVRLVRTILLAHISDYPEQLLIACASGSSSPVSMAKTPSFGSPTPYPPRTKHETLHRIKRILRTPGLRASNLPRYKRLSLDLGLNGVHEPFWRDWNFSDPSVFLAPDALHQWHRFFYDHVVSWASEIIGDASLDNRYARLQKHVGYRQFPTGFTHFTQHTCREFRDIQRSFIAIIASHEKISDSALLAFRGLL
ncbi:hypothetical protein SCHPADRAFT_948276, partial [Schizopora paradoxa]